MPLRWYRAPAKWRLRRPISVSLSISWFCKRMSDCPKKPWTTGKIQSLKKREREEKRKTIEKKKREIEKKERKREKKEREKKRKRGKKKREKKKERERENLMVVLFGIKERRGCKRKAFQTNMLWREWLGRVSKKVSPRRSPVTASSKPSSDISVTSSSKSMLCWSEEDRS